MTLGLAIALSVMGQMECEEMNTNPWAKDPKMENFPQTLMWRGKLVEEMEKPELIEALTEVWELYRSSKEDAYDCQMKLLNLRHRV